MHLVSSDRLDSLIREALKEDSTLDDITTKSLNYGNLATAAVFKAKEKGVLAGINVVKQVFKLVDKKLKLKILKKDGENFQPGDILAKVSGSVSSILSSERTVLNFLTRLSGIATITREFVNKVKPYRAKIMDTRKTTPGLRILEKYAVRMGGGYNHRYDLAEAILIKDNHIAALKRRHKNLDLGELIKIARKKSKNKNIEVEIEVTNKIEFRQAIESTPDIIMFDNMKPKQIRDCVKLRNRLNKRVKLEISGNVSLENVKSLASLGVDRISIGRLTHSPKAVDISLEFLR